VLDFDQVIGNKQPKILLSERTVVLVTGNLIATEGMTPDPIDDETWEAMVAARTDEKIPPWLDEPAEAPGR
jgi:hypothetical protein